MLNFLIPVAVLVAPLFLNEIVTGIMLPGSKCPEVPLTHKRKCFPSNTDAIYSIPLSNESPTHLFTEINQTDVKENNYQIAVTEKDDGTHRLTGFEVMDHRNGPGLIWNFVAQNNASFTLESFAYNDTNPIFEDVRVWCEEPFYFIWSCVEGKDEAAAHEEALIVLKQAFSLSKVDLHSVVKNYVTEDLISLIN